MDADIIILIKWGVTIEFLKVYAHIACSWVKYNTVPLQFECAKVCSRHDNWYNHGIPDWSNMYYRYKLW